MSDHRRSRRLAAVAFPLALFATVLPAQDVLVLRGGQRRTGALRSCIGARCTLGGESVSRAEIAWIGLATDAEPPRTPLGAGDELHLASGEMRQGTFEALSLGTVLFAGESFERPAVRWIYFAPPPRESDDGPIYRPSPAPEPAPGESAPPTPTPPATPGPTPQPPGGSPPTPARASAGERGGLWTGTMNAHAFGTASDVFSEWTSTVTVRLREYRFPLLCWDPRTGKAPRVGTLLRLEPEGSVVANRFHCSGPYLSCGGSGSVTVSAGLDEPGIGHPAAVYLKTVDHDTTGCLGFDVPLGGGVYHLTVATPSADTFQVSYVSGPNSSTSDSGFLSFGAGWYPILPIIDCADREMRRLEGGGGVMRGSFLGPCTGCCPQVAVSWSVCREGAACPPPPDLPTPGAPESEDPCGDLQQIRAPLDLAMDQQRLYLDQLRQLLDQHQRLQEQARQWQGDFEHATWDCRLWTAARFLMSLLVSNWSPTDPGRALAPAPGRPGTQWTPEENPAKELVNFLNFVEKVVAGQDSWVLPNTEFGPGGSEWVSLEDLWDGFSTVSGALGKSAPSELKKGLQECSAPTIEGVLDGAYEYLRLLEQIPPLAERMNEATNRVRQKDLELFDRWSRYQRDCREYQRCKGGNPAACDDWPPAGPLAPAPPPQTGPAPAR